MIFVLLFIAWTSTGAHLLPSVYEDRSDCQVNEGAIATALEKTPGILGWVIVGEPCAAVREAKKL